MRARLSSRQKILSPIVCCKKYVRIMKHKDNPSWASVKQELTSAQGQLQRRRIEFHKARQPYVGINTKATASHSEPTTKAKATDPLSGEELQLPSVGLYPVQRVTQCLEWRQPSRIGPGFYNLGNTCFLNSTLQCLVYTPPLAQLLLEEPSQRGGEQHDLFDIFSSFMRHVHNPSYKGPFSPKLVVSNLRRIGRQFRLGRQEDAHEFMRMLLDGIQTSLLRRASVKPNQGRIAETTMIDRIFGGYLRNQLACNLCGYRSNTYDHCQDISLDVTGSIRSINQALQQFCKKEVLGKGNEWECGRCKKRVCAAKQMTIYKAPMVLVVHLKRFEFGSILGKVGKMVEYSEELVVHPSGEQNRAVRYTLYGVLVHQGGSVHSGHYYSFVKGPNGLWHEMDDSTVRQVSAKTALSQQAYMLYYVRTDIDNREIASPGPASKNAGQDVPPPTKTASEGQQAKVIKTTDARTPAADTKTTGNWADVFRKMHAQGSALDAEVASVPNGWVEDDDDDAPDYALHGDVPGADGGSFKQPQGLAAFTAQFRKAAAAKSQRREVDGHAESVVDSNTSNGFMHGVFRERAPSFGLELSDESDAEDREPFRIPEIPPWAIRQNRFKGTIHKFKRFTLRSASLPLKLAAKRRRLDEAGRDETSADNSVSGPSTDEIQKQESSKPQPTLRRKREEIEFSAAVSEASHRHAQKHFKKLQASAEVVGGAVGGWEDAENQDELEVAKSVVQHQRKQENVLAESRRPDAWDAALDAGRQKTNEAHERRKSET